MWDTLSCIQCPDCSSVIPIKFSLLVDNGQMVHLSICARCHDMKTIRIFKMLDQKTYIEAYNRRLPIISYRRR